MSVIQSRPRLESFRFVLLSDYIFIISNWFACNRNINGFKNNKRPTRKRKSWPFSGEWIFPLNHLSCALKVKMYLTSYVSIYNIYCSSFRRTEQLFHDHFKHFFSAISFVPTDPIHLYTCLYIQHHWFILTKEIHWFILSFCKTVIFLYSSYIFPPMDWFPETITTTTTNTPIKVQYLSVCYRKSCVIAFFRCGCVFMFICMCVCVNPGRTDGRASVSESDYGE